MRIRHSEEANLLYELFRPYIVYKGIHASIDENAPDNVKRAFEEWKELTNKEYMDAMCL